MNEGEKRHRDGGDDLHARKPKRPSYAFTVQEVSEEELTQAREQPTPSDRDPGRFEWPMVAIVLILLPLVYGLQQWTRSLHGETLDRAPAEVRRSEEIADPGVSQLTIMSKLAVKLAFIFEEQGQRVRHQPLSELAADEKSRRGDVGETAYSPHQEMLDENGLSVSDIDSIAWTRIDRLRAAIVAGELDGADAALTRLRTLQGEGISEELKAELYWLSQIYERGPGAVPAEATASLESRHGWFGSLASTFGKHPSDPKRWEIVSGGEEIVDSLGFVEKVVGAIFLFGIAALIVFIIKFVRKGYLLRYVPPDPGGSVFLETFGVFLGGFAFLLLLGLMLFGMGIEGTGLAAAVDQVLLWSLVGTTAWPLVRRMRFRTWAQSVGLHRGRGVGIEVTAGVLGYLVSCPIMVIGALLGYIVEAAIGADEAGPSFGYGMFDAPPEESMALFVLSILTAVVWAPLVEEVVFRGSLFRYLSTRMNLLASVALTSLLFGLIHPYTPAGLIQVATGGLVFGFMRCWRDSLIAPITAHALHNGVLSMASVSLISML